MLFTSRNSGSFNFFSNIFSKFYKPVFESSSILIFMYHSTISLSPSTNVLFVSRPCFPACIAVNDHAAAAGGGGVRVVGPSREQQELGGGGGGACACEIRAVWQVD